jgi:hypothetical protein
VGIAQATHRPLKLAAVMHGVTVQTLVEQAMLEFLTSHADWLETSPATLQQPVKSQPRKSR